MIKSLRAGLVLATAAVCLSGCATGIPGLSGIGSGASQANAGLAQFLSDPNCAHHDEATFVSGAGGLPASFQAKVMRDCAARPVAVTTGAVIAAATTTP